MTIAASRTSYGNYEFRSRTEARWAYFFNLVGIPRWFYEHEKYGFLSGTKYIPDFWIPQHYTHVEIKGRRPTSDELQKCESLADETCSMVIIAWGLPKRWDIACTDDDVQGMMVFGIYETSGGAGCRWIKDCGWIVDKTGRPAVYSHGFDYDGNFIVNNGTELIQNQLVRNKQHFDRLFSHGVFKKVYSAKFEEMDRQQSFF